MRNKFDEQLEKLHIELINMGALCNCGGGCGNNWTPYNNGCNDNNCGCC